MSWVWHAGLAVVFSLVRFLASGRTPAVLGSGVP